MEPISKDQYFTEAERRYGPDKMQWKFRCPCCQTVTSVKEWLDKDGAGMVAFSCIGRTQEKPRDAFKKGKGPCNYSGGGLFRLNPIPVIDPEEKDGVSHFFDFADDPMIKDTP